jgi:hypothetical protein
MPELDRWSRCVTIVFFVPPKSKDDVPYRVATMVCQQGFGAIEPRRFGGSAIATEWACDINGTHWYVPKKVESVFLLSVVRLPAAITR